MLGGSVKCGGVEGGCLLAFPFFPRRPLPTSAAPCTLPQRPPGPGEFDDVRDVEFAEKVEAMPRERPLCTTCCLRMRMACFAAHSRRSTGPRGSCFSFAARPPRVLGVALPITAHACSGGGGSGRVQDAAGQRGRQGAGAGGARPTLSRAAVSAAPPMLHLAFAAKRRLPRKRQPAHSHPSLQRFRQPMPLGTPVVHPSCRRAEATTPPPGWLRRRARAAARRASTQTCASRRLQRQGSGAGSGGRGEGDPGAAGLVGQPGHRAPCPSYRQAPAPSKAATTHTHPCRASPCKLRAGAERV